MSISEVTRRNIFGALSENGQSWHGRLSEIEFLERLYNLRDLPSTDQRSSFPDARSDIIQHRINNYDWDDDWVFSDERFQLLKGPDEILLKFLCEMLHPLVRTDMYEIGRLLSIFNNNLEADGWKIYEDSKISGKPVFGPHLLEKKTSGKSTTGVTGLEVGKQTEKEQEEIFDVFLCHNSQDKPAVKEIGEQLKEKGIRPWLDEWELRPGFPWQRELEEQIENANAAAVFIGASGIGPWQRHESEAFFAQFVKRKCPVIPVLLPEAPGEARKSEPDFPAFLKNMQLVDFRKSDPEPLKQLIWGITGKKETDQKTTTARANTTITKKDDQLCE